MFSLSFVHSVALTTFSSKYFNYIFLLDSIEAKRSSVTLARLPATKGLDSSSDLSAMPILFPVYPAAAGYGAELFILELQELGFVPEGLKCIKILCFRMRVLSLIQSFSGSVIRNRLIAPPAAFKAMLDIPKTCIWYVVDSEKLLSFPGIFLH